MLLASLEVVGFLIAFAVLALLAQRSRVSPATRAILAAAAAELGLSVEAGAGTCRLTGTLDGHPVEVHRVVDGWAVTVHGVSTRDVPPPAQVGAGRLLLPAPVHAADALVAAIRAALALAAPGPAPPHGL
ncbi:MAG: hypothetical protein H6706_06385 [Myxococcales bacterium]|nr:hypothetical protein [Myxococcales bacterium]